MKKEMKKEIMSYILLGIAEGALAIGIATLLNGELSRNISQVSMVMAGTQLILVTIGIPLMLGGTAMLKEYVKLSCVPNLRTPGYVIASFLAVFCLLAYSSSTYSFIDFSLMLSVLITLIPWLWVVLFKFLKMKKETPSNFKTEVD